MADKAHETRPLSPHLQVWRWHPTMASSIFHRMTGVGNALGGLMLTIWLAAIAVGPEAYAFMETLILSPLGQVVLFGFTLSLIYHFANGLRHLFWDAGAGYSPRFADAMSIFNIVFAVVVTVAIWIAAYTLDFSSAST